MCVRVRVRATHVQAADVDALHEQLTALAAEVAAAEHGEHTQASARAREALRARTPPGLAKAVRAVSLTPWRPVRDVM